MLDETKKLIRTTFIQGLTSSKYRTWFIARPKIGISEDIMTGKVEFNFDYAHTAKDDKCWVSEEEGLRRFRLIAFW